MNLPSSFSKPFNPPGPSPLVLYVSWIPPADCSWKLNFSGFVADHKTGRGGAAFILRDENAILKAACAAPVEHAEDMVAAELLALRNGLQIAINEGVDYLEIEGDCSTVIQMLRGLVVLTSPSMRGLLAECLGYIKNFRCVKTRQVNIHNNVSTNRMATTAIGLEEPVYWFSNPPPELLAMLIEDVIGRYVPLYDL